MEKDKTEEVTMEGTVNKMGWDIFVDAYGPKRLTKKKLNDVITPS